METENNENYVGKLQEYCAKNKIPAPSYEEESSEGLPHVKEFVMSCRVSSVVEIAEKSPKKKEGKNKAAKNMWARKDELLELFKGVKMDTNDNTVAICLLEEEEKNMKMLANLSNIRVEVLTKDVAKKVAGFYKTLQLKGNDILLEIDVKHKNLYTILEDLGKKFEFEVSKCEAMCDDLGDEYKFICTIRVADLPANVAFAAAQTAEEAENDAARAALIYMKLMTKTLSK